MVTKQSEGRRNRGICEMRGRGEKFDIRLVAEKLGK